MRALAGLILGSCLLCGCAKQPRIVGSWAMGLTQGGPPVDYKQDFMPDGSYKGRTNVMGKDGRQMILHETGRWEMAGETVLTVTISDLSWEFPGVPEADAARARALLEQAKGKLIAEDNENATQTLTWLGENQFSVNVKGTTFTMTRTK